MAEQVPSPIKSPVPYSSRTFPRGARARSRGAKPRMIHRDPVPVPVSSAVATTHVSRSPPSIASSPGVPEVPVLTRSKSLQDLREDLTRTSRGVLEKGEESEVAAHRCALGREISVRTTIDV